MAGNPKDFSSAQWKKIFKKLNASGADYGLPAQRVDSLLLGSWNLRQFGNLDEKQKPRQPEAFRFIASVIMHFDLVALQEIKDDLDSLRLLHRLLPEYDLVVSDATGNHERLGFFSKFERVRRTNLAAEIDMPMTDMRDIVESNWQAFVAEFQRYGRQQDRIRFPQFLGFDRAPFSISFEAGSREAPLRFLSFNAHIYYGERPEDRLNEFVELLNWLFRRWGMVQKIFSPNFIVFGDMNTEVMGDGANLQSLRGHIKRQTDESKRQALNDARGPANRQLREDIKRQAVMTPFLTGHDGEPAPKLGSNLKGTQRYDQIFMLIRAAQHPEIEEYAVVDIPRLVRDAIGARPSENEQLARIEQQISDHLPIWMRLKLPDPLP